MQLCTLPWLGSRPGPADRGAGRSGFQLEESDQVFGAVPVGAADQLREFRVGCARSHGRSSLALGCRHPK